MMGVWLSVGKCMFPCCVNSREDCLDSASEITQSHTHLYTFRRLHHPRLNNVLKLRSVESNNQITAIVYWPSEGSCHE